MNSVLKKGAMALALGATVAGAAAPAEAQRYYRRGHSGDDAAIAIGAGIIGLGLGAAIASSSGRYDRGYYGGYDRGYYGRGYDRRYYGRSYGYRDRYYGRGYRRCGSGTTGAIIGGAAGALLGREIARGGRGYYRYRGGNGTTGAIIGGAAGALLGREIGRSC